MKILKHLNSNISLKFIYKLIILFANIVIFNIKDKFRFYKKYYLLKKHIKKKDNLLNLIFHVTYYQYHLDTQSMEPQIFSSSHYSFINLMILSIHPPI